MNTINTEATTRAPYAKPERFEGESKAAYKARCAEHRAAYDAAVDVTQGDQGNADQQGGAAGDTGNSDTAGAGTGDTQQGDTQQGDTQQGDAGNGGNLDPVVATAVHDPLVYGGYDFNKWPSFMPFIPSYEAIEAVTALGIKNPRTANALAQAVYFEQSRPENRELAQLVNYYDVGAALVSQWPHKKPDHKGNVCRDHHAEGVTVAAAGVPNAVTRRVAEPGARGQAVKCEHLTARGLEKVRKHFAGINLPVPLWLSDPQAAMAAYKAAQAAQAAQATPLPGGTPNRTTVDA